MPIFYFHYIASSSPLFFYQQFLPKQPKPNQPTTTNPSQIQQPCPYINITTSNTQYFPSRTPPSDGIYTAGARVGAGAVSAATMANYPQLKPHPIQNPLQNIFTIQIPPQWTQSPLTYHRTPKPLSSLYCVDKHIHIYHI